MATFIERTGTTGRGPRLAVKDLIDVEGMPTTAGSKAFVLTRGHEPAEKDAPLLAGARAAGAVIVGKANLHELAAATTGVNPWYGTPRNPLDPTRVPGGSSSGSAVAVADGDADIAYGSDTGGSVRVPSACCGTAGLKTTFGRISVEGVHPLAPSLDTIGPMARDVARLELGMQLLEPGFARATTTPAVVGRLRIAGTDPIIDAAIDAALRAAELEVIDIDLPGWATTEAAFVPLFCAEAYAANRDLFEQHPEAIAEPATSLLGLGSIITGDQVAQARAAQAQWQRELLAAFERVEVIATPTILSFPPPMEGSDTVEVTAHLAAATAPVNLAGAPAVAIPVPAAGGPGLPASLQLVGPLHGEAELLALAAEVETAVRIR